MEPRPDITSPLERSFRIPARFHPAHSLLGRWIRRFSKDDRSAASTYLVAAATLGVVLLVAQFLTWSYVQPAGTPMEARLALAFAALAVLYLLFAIAGRQPAYRIDIGPAVLRFTGAAGDVQIRLSDVRSVASIPAQTYHVEHARTVGVRTYVNRLPPTLLVIDVAGHPVVVGLEPSDAAELERILVEGAPASTRVGAA